VGGGAANTACSLAKLGSRAAVLGVVGDDGDWLIRQLCSYGVSTSAIGRDATEPTALTVAVTTPEDRTFLTYLGANRAFPSALADAATANRLATARHVHLAFPPEPDAARDLFADIRGNGCTISLDVGWHESWLSDRRLGNVLPLLDLFFPNEAEGRCITGQAEPEQMLRWFADAGSRRVALKLGAAGAALLWDGEVRIDAGLTVKTIDTTGAGDCFNAGFLHSWLQKWEPEVCLRAANICGALSTEAYGGVAGAPDAARLKELLEAHSCEK
jgi:sugar/nucleoside kinase (ribokinase family)